MKINIEGWVPTPLEQALIDGTIDEVLAGMDLHPEEVPDDLLEFQEFGEAMDEIIREIEEEFRDDE